MLLKQQKLLHQKQFSLLMEQNELVELRTELEKREADFKKKEAFLNETLRPRLRDFRYDWGRRHPARGPASDHAAMVLDFAG